MQCFRIVTRLYKACDFRLQRVLGARLAGVAPVQVRELAALESGGRAHDAIAYERKMWRALRVARFLSRLPFVRGIAICNSLAFQMVHEESDIDLFIIAAPGRVWSARWWVTGMLALMRLRPGEAHRDPICVSFFIDERVTSLSDLMIERDVYFDYWLRSLMPVFGDHVLFRAGSWTTPEFRVTYARGWVARAIEWCARSVSETVLRRQQEYIMPDDMRRAAAEAGTAVVFSATVIKMHVTDRRAEIRDHVFAE